MGMQQWALRLGGGWAAQRHARAPPSPSMMVSSGTDAGAVGAAAGRKSKAKGNTSLMGRFSDNI